MEMKRNTNVGNGRMPSGPWGGMCTIMNGAVKGIILMGLVFCVGACSSSDDEEDGNPVIENGKINGYGYVDLGLSVKWATCNMGATTPSDYGNYYAWGEISTKTEYTEDNCVTYGAAIDDIGGDPCYDVACANWGGTWRLPTKSELEELENKCTWTWTTMNGKKGCKVVGLNGNSIFLPAAGCYGGAFDDSASLGLYWSSTSLENSNFGGAYYLCFSKHNHWKNSNPRYFGYSVRPVSE